MYQQLTSGERDRLAELRHKGATQKEIAVDLGRSPATISREVRRNPTDDTYHAAQAQQKAEQRRRDRPLVRTMDDPVINQDVRAGLAQQWSPEQIAGRMKQQHPEATDRRVSPHGHKAGRCRRCPDGSPRRPSSPSRGPAR